MNTHAVCLTVVAALAIASAAPAAVTVQGTEQTPWTPVTNQLALTHGVTFTSVQPWCAFGDNGAGVFGIYGTSPNYSPNFADAAYFAPIEATFVDMGDGVTPAVVNGTINAVFGDGGGDTDGIRLRAYDINNNLLGTQTALSVTWGNISITGVGIHRVVFDQSGLGDPNSDTFLDWLSYPEPVALPSPGPALALGAAGFSLLSRRRRAGRE